jgi:hypothetical protein
MCGLLALGILFQIADWAQNRSLWQDEIALALDLQKSSFAQLAQPLDNNQAAPIGFLWISKSLTTLLGQSERALRLLPLFSAIAALVLSRKWLGKTFSPLEAFLAFGLLIIQPRLIQYAAEFKPYSTDVAAALIVLVLHSKLLESQFRISQFASYATAAISLPWLSFPAALIVIASIIILAFELLSQRQWKSLIALILIGIAFAVSTAIQIHLLNRTEGNSALLEFWQPNLMPRDSISSALIWLARMWVELFNNPIKATSAWFAAILAIIGLIILYFHRRPQIAFLIAFTLAAAFAAAALRRYPIGDRVALYLMPILCLLIALPIATIGSYGFDFRPFRPREIPSDTVSSSPPCWRQIAMLAIVVFVIFDPLGRTIGNLFLPHNRDREESRPVLRQLAAKSHPGDPIYFYIHSALSYEYYAPKFALHLNTTYGSAANPAADPRLAALLSHGPFWVYFCHGSVLDNTDYRLIFLQYLDARARRLDTIQAPGCWTYLYQPNPIQQQ